MWPYSAYSYWLESAGDATVRPPLDGSEEADVAILGAGFSGLWTAYYLLRADPSLRVVLLESETAGYGASGRNGGWCYAGFPLTLEGMEHRFGGDGAREVHAAMVDTVAEVGRVSREEGIECDFHQGGLLRIARGTHQRPAIEVEFETARRLGVSGFSMLSTDEVCKRVYVRGAVGGLYQDAGASIHPGKLVRGLAHVVEGRGATIYEGTPVREIVAGKRPSLITDRGTVQARVVVAAGEAYLSRLRPFHRQTVPIYSLIALTEPVPDQLWNEIGWRNRELLSSTRLTVDYLNRTADGRVLFGSRGAPYHMGSRIDDEFDRHDPTHRRIGRSIVDWFPALRDVRITHVWGGPVGMPRDFTPAIGCDRASGIATARGYTGSGVATTSLAGRILSDLITDRRTPLTELPIVGLHSPNWEPEPLRWLGIRYMQSAFGRIDARAERTGRAPTGRSLAERLTAH